MKQMIGRQAWMGVLLLLVAGVATAPVEAQQDAGERITILVPNLAPGEGLRDRFGNRTARELRSLIDDLHTHQTVDDRDLRSVLRQYDLRTEDLYQCINARQLAMQQGWGLVLCGEYQAAGNGEVLVTASFIGAEGGETFDVEPFTVSERDPQAAARQILETFDEWQRQQRHTYICSQYMESDQWEQALTNCRRALEINPDARSVQYMVAFIHRELDQRDESLAKLEAILEADPIHQDALQLAGIVATEKGERERAREYLDRYMELNPADTRVRLSIATDIANAGDPEAAMSFAKEGLEHEPDNLDLLTYVGHFATNAAVQAESRLARNGDEDPIHISSLFATAADSYEQVLEAQGEETDPQILERLVIAQFKLGRADEAIALGRRATEIAPDNAAVWDAYSRALAEGGEVQEALAAIERVEELGRTSPALTQRYAGLQLQQGNTGAAVNALRAAVERGDLESSDAFRVIFRQAHQTFQAGRLNEAYQILDQARPLAMAESDRLARNFWRGYYVFEQAKVAHEPQTAESARRAKPMFERAIELFQQARGYEQIERSANVPAFINQAQQFLEIQDALIRRGR